MDKRAFEQLIDHEMIGQSCSSDTSVAMFTCNCLFSLLNEAKVDIVRSNRVFTINGNEYLITIKFSNMQAEHSVYASLEATSRSLPRTTVSSVDLFKVRWEYRGDEKVIETVLLDNGHDDEISMAKYVEQKLREVERQALIKQRQCAIAG